MMPVRTRPWPPSAHRGSEMATQGEAGERLRTARQAMDDAVRDGGDPVALRSAGAELLAAEKRARRDASGDSAREEPRACANCGVASMPGPEGGCPNCGQPIQ